MLIISESIDAIQEFLDSGGQVLSYIGILIFVLWILIFERLSFFWLSATFCLLIEAIVNFILVRSSIRRM